MGIMDKEKSFEAENHHMYRKLLESVMRGMEKRYSAYYADHGADALETVKRLFLEFETSLGGGKHCGYRGLSDFAPDSII